MSIDHPPKMGKDDYPNVSTSWLHSRLEPRNKFSSQIEKVGILDSRFTLSGPKMIKSKYN